MVPFDHPKPSIRASFSKAEFSRAKSTLHSVCPINQSELLKHCASLDLLLGGRWGDVDVEVDDDGLIKDAKLWSLLATCKLAFSPSPDCFFFLSLSITQVSSSSRTVVLQNRKTMYLFPPSRLIPITPSMFAEEHCRLIPAPPRKKWYREPGSWWNIKSSKNKPLRERSPTTTTTRTVQMEYLRTYFYPLNDKGFRSFAITTVRGLVEDEFAKSEQPSKMMISTSSAETLSTAMSFWPVDVVGP